MIPVRQRPALRFSLRMLFVAVTVCGLALGWLGLQLKWIQERRQARAWLGASEQSWYAPALPGALRIDAPWSVRTLGEDGIVGIGLDRDEFAGDVPYSEAELKSLFPEARVDFSRDGRWIEIP